MIRIRDVVGVADNRLHSHSWQHSRSMGRVLVWSSLACMVACVVVCIVGCATTQSGEWSSKSRSSTSSPAAPIVVSNSNAMVTPAAPPALMASASNDNETVALASPATAAEMADPVFLRSKAIETAELMTRSNSAILMAHGIEALISAPDSLDAAAGRGLVDNNRGVRFVAVIALAKAKRCELTHLIEPLLRDESESVRAAAMGALAICGRTVDLSPFAVMVRTDDPEVRANVYVVLGLIGNKSAAPMVRDSVGAGLSLVDSTRVRVVELQAAEALVRLGRPDEIEPIRAALFAPAEQGGLTAMACQIVGRLKDERSKPMLQRLVDASGDSERAPEIRIAALEALGRLGGSDTEIFQQLQPYVASAEAGLRAQAATALGTISAKQALPVLSVLLVDPVPVVRVAAASSILALTKRN